jgi:2-polyprenyl-3-methyl-5-hydroxy-6-metoxy-1,4-benzoquinol methylase
LWAPVIDAVLNAKVSGRILDLGCGNGAFAGELNKNGYTVVGVEPSQSGVSQAKSRWPDCEFHVGSAYDNLAESLGVFDCVTSLEVVEHVYSPREYARTVFNVLKPGGVAVISTPFHGYWKNLLLAITGKLEAHFSPLWDHGHIKFWSEKSLTELLLETGFKEITFRFAGRRYPFSKSMIAIAYKPTIEPSAT